MHFEPINTCDLPLSIIPKNEKNVSSQQSAAVEARWARNPEVDGLEPSSARLIGDFPVGSTIGFGLE